MEQTTSLSTILVVDDDSTLRIPLVRALSKAGMNVVSAKNGMEAFELFCLHKPDLIVSDIQMPVQTGYELCAAVRATENGKFVPFLMMTGSEGFESIEKSYEVGATDFISKPIRYQVLVNRVRYILRARQVYAEWKSSQNQLESLGRVLDNSASEIYFLNSSTCAIESANRSALTNLGYSAEEIYQYKLPELFKNDEVQSASMEEACHALKTGQLSKFHCITEIIRKDGSHYPIEGYVYAAKNQENSSIVCIFEDVTLREQSAQRMRQLAYYDSLTHLPNRELFVENFKLCLAASETSGYQVALLFVDLDNFKNVNDSLGHNAGDELLEEMARRLRECISKNSPPGTYIEDSIARFGGDEFAILLSDFDTQSDVVSMANQIVTALSMPSVIQEREIVVTPSIGIVVAPEHGDTPALLLQRADVAMYQAKKQGKSGYHIYSDELHSQGLNRIELERDLRLAVGKNEFRLAYQPKFEVTHKNIVGFEALIRWQRNGEAVSPSHFIPVAEESNLIWIIGKWVIHEAAKQIREWLDLGVNRDLSIAINLSSKQFSDPELFPFIVKTLREHAIPPSSIQWEITETVFMTNIDAVSDMLTKLKDLGCSIALDDFGTGYSSLSYLHLFPLDVLKIDKSFISQINTSTNNSIIAAIAAMAKNLGLKIVAEGVETEEQLQLVLKLNIDYLQGYLWGKPMPAEEALQLMQNEKEQKSTINDV